jgi:hypothetical protein
VSGELAELAGKALAAIDSQDPELIEAAFDDAAEIRTGRSVYRGIDGVIRWATKRYDHLDKRYTIAMTHAKGDTVLVLGNVEYVWREEGEVGDRTPIALLLEFAGGRVSSLTVADDPEKALEEFES